NRTYERAKQKQANFEQNWRNERYKQAGSSKNIVVSNSFEEEEKYSREKEF
ncbi:11689_t:CDS:1, partial [Scutellospora calospora]